MLPPPVISSSHHGNHNCSCSAHTILYHFQGKGYCVLNRNSCDWFYGPNTSLRKATEWQNEATHFLCWHRRAHRHPGAVCCCNVSCSELMFLFIQEISVEAKSQFIHIFAGDGNRPPDNILS